MEALVRVNGGIGQGQWGVLKRVNGCWSGSMGVLNNGGSMGVLTRINGGIGQAQ